MAKHVNHVCHGHPLRKNHVREQGVRNRKMLPLHLTEIPSPVLFTRNKTVACKSIILLIVIVLRHKWFSFTANSIVLNIYVFEQSLRVCQLQQSTTKIILPLIVLNDWRSMNYGSHSLGVCFKVTAGYVKYNTKPKNYKNYSLI